MSIKFKVTDLGTQGKATWENQQKAGTFNKSEIKFFPNWYG